MIGHDPSIVEYIPIWLSRVSSSFWGQPARRTGVTLAPWMIAALTVAAVVLCAYAVVRGRAHRWATAPLALLIVGQVALMFRTNWTAHARIGRLPALQGRYLFGLVVPLAVLVTIAFARHLRTRPPARTVAVAAAVAGVGVGLHAFLGWSMLTGGYWAADGGGIAGQLRAVVAWSPLPMVLTLGTFLATGVATVLAGGSVGRSLFGRRGPQTAPAGAAEAGGLR
ncbi:MAG: hypothetical protein JXA83_01655 [Acidimicrobiales bacterium]|nr:hypothetical protein [Acidimicrobiales bacterium]